MTKQELDNHFKELDKIQRLKKSIHTLSIDWETDLDKIDFSALRSGAVHDIENKYQKRWIDVISISNEWQYTEKSQLEKEFFADIATHDLIEFIAKGNKIIPPLYVRGLEYCGETFTKKVISDIQRADGTHRVFVSYILGLKEIPIVAVEKITKFSFPVDKWDFESTDENFTAKSKNGEHRIKLDNIRIWIDNTTFYDDVLTIVIFG